MVAVHWDECGDGGGGAARRFLTMDGVKSLNH